MFEKQDQIINSREFNQDNGFFIGLIGLCVCVFE